MNDHRCCEHSNESFQALIDAIKALGFDEETASRFAARIGDCPIVDQDGKIVVLGEDGKEVIARLTLDCFGKPQPKVGTPPPKALRCLPPADYYYIRHNRESFARGLVKSIIALGYDETTATRYAWLIAKTPCRNEAGKIVVIECAPEFRELAALDLDLFPDRITGDRE